MRQQTAAVVENNPRLIAYCGLYCGACGSYISKKCPGCKAAGERLSWCGVRKCCGAKTLDSCAGCGAYADFRACRQLNNIISRVIGFFKGTSRVRSVQKLKEAGPVEYARFMSAQGLQSLKKNG